ncbi:unnamed protein product [Brachionus calyciflorus]|uniref:CCHC-type domain-containing protein n=1 Tax=Brachionus calyciflorus TaxID=104777 RepID=A0A813XJV2_9BILA|nr:unnamed protein product [Brachionus calyciflorus]
MSTNQSSKSNPIESKERKTGNSSNGTSKVQQKNNGEVTNKRRRPRTKPKNKKEIDNNKPQSEKDQSQTQKPKDLIKKDPETKPVKAQQNEQKPQNNPVQTPKDLEVKKDEKFVHTVFGGMSKDKFSKQKQNESRPPPQQQQQQHPPRNQDNLIKSSNPVTIQQNRKVTVTANKSVIVSILDPNLNQTYSIEETKINMNHNNNNNNLTNGKIYSSSLNDRELNQVGKHLTNTNQASMTNTKTNVNNNNNNDLIEKFELELEKNYVFRMKKFKTDKFRCNICNYLCDTIEVARKHINGQIHRNNLETIKLDMRIRDLELPQKSKLDNLSSFLIDFYSKNVISNEKLKQYYDFYYKFKEKYQQKHPDASINITGSLAHGICFNDSTCDITVEYDSKTNRSSADILAEMDLFILQEMNSFLDLRYDPELQALKKNSKLNKLTFKAINSSLVFNFTTGLYTSSPKTNFLIKSYLDLDERARILAFCFKYLARIAQIDKVDLCTLPSHAYLLMTIYFLQKLNPPVLPVLHELCDSKKLNKSFGKKESNNEPNDENYSFDEDNENDRSFIEKDSVQDFGIFRKNVTNFVNGKNWLSQNQMTIGELWLKLLTFYSIDFGFKKTLISIRRSQRINKSSMKMYTKKISIEDPFYLKQSLSRNLMTQTNKYIISVISRACLYFVNSTHYKTSQANELEGKSVNIVDNLIEETKIYDARKARKDLENTSDISSDTEDSDSELSLDGDDEQQSESIEFLTDNKKNLKSTKLDKELNKMLKITNLDSESNGQGPSLVSSIDTYSPISTPNQAEKVEKFNFEQEFSRPVFDLNMDSINYEDNLNDKFNSVLNLSCPKDEVSSCLNDLVDLVVDKYENVYDLMPNLKLTNLIWDKNQTFAFKFTQSTLNFAKSPPRICSHCNKEGHLQNECPQDQLPDLEKLPNVTIEWRDVLTNVCYCIMDDNKQTKDEELIRNNLLEDIRKLISQKYPDAKLSLFGSSNNGFAMKKSDLDICMTFSSTNKSSQEISFKKIIRTIGSLFRRDFNFDQIEERVSAKVPIVKFRHKKTNIEGDISLYNTLALQNTDLLRSYVEIDSRLQVLGHVVKHFAKICRIGDASCGSLSSYAYIVMMLHYLMNTDPPVLPCLQRLNRDKLPLKETQLEIDGWDCWFNRDLDNLHLHWSHYKKNTLSVGELWLGFLRYYTEVFDWENHVVCIRNTNPLTRKEKNWTKHRLAIEDPFELSHNLAAGVSHKMGLYILRSFAKARSLFGNIVHDFRSQEIRFNLEYFFNPRSLVEGNPPMDRNCYSCLKIGHQTKDCPLANAKRRERQLSDMFDGRQEDMSNVVCYKCRQTGHKAKDCISEMKRVKTTSFSTSESKCFNCNQVGHFARDCVYSQGKIQIQQTIPTVSHQQSAPPPKMVSVLSNPAHPIILHTGEKTQLLVNNSQGLASISSAPLLPAPNVPKLNQNQNGRFHHHQQQNSLNRQQSYPNQYTKNHQDHFYHHYNQQYPIMTNEALNSLHYSSPTDQYSYAFSSSMPHSMNQIYSSQYGQYSPSMHQYIIYNNTSPRNGSDYKIFGANFGRLDEKNIDLDIVQLNQS